MKTIFSPFYILLFIVTILFTGCHFSKKPNFEKHQNIESEFFINLPTTVDSLEQALKAPELNSAQKIVILSELYRKFAQRDTTIAFAYIDQIKSLKTTISDSLTKAIYYNALGSYYQKKERLQEAVTLYDKALLILAEDISIIANGERAKTLANKGFIFQLYGDYETAYEFYLEAEELFIKTNNYNRLINLYGKMSDIFLRNSDYEQDEKILQKEYSIIGKVTDLDAIVDFYIHQSSVCFYNEEFEKCDQFINKALEILNQTQNQHQLHTVYFNMGFFTCAQEQYEKSEIYYRKSLLVAEKSGNKLDICDGLLAVGKILYYQEKFREAEVYTNHALTLAQEIQSKLLIRNCYDLLSCVKYSQNDFKNAFDYQELYIDSSNELTSTETQNKLNFMTIKYDLAKKETNIRDLENKSAIQQYQVKLRDTLLIGITLLVFILIVVIIFYVRYMQRTRLISEIRIKQLEQEQQLIATQSVLDGETRERVRLARDLHDGMGGLLTGVRLNLQNAKKGLKLEPENVERFSKALELLDESVSEMRRISHHLMPKSLSLLGLKPAIRDFCNNISSIITFDYFGDEKRIDPQVEVMIYRTIHELVNNALKHSRAEKIMVQIMQEPNRIAFTVEDNGCGFDSEVETMGLGLKSIKARIAAYNGNILVDSKINVGTEISVELKLL